MMDERYCNEINKRIISGNLPLERLYPVPFESEPRINRASGMMELFRSQKELSEAICYLLALDVLDCMSEKMVIENDAKNEAVKFLPILMEKVLSTSETALVLNTGYPSSALSPRGKAYKAASQLCPYVTALDKVLCIMGNMDENKNRQQAIAFVLSLAQAQELHYGYTIDIDKIDMSTPVISLIMQPWDANTNPLLKKLSPQEIDRLNFLLEKRREIHAIAEKERLEAEAIAKETDNDWNLFLEMLFERSERENQIIQEILDEALLPKEKLQSLTEFAESIREEHDGLAMIRGHQEDTERINNSVIDRLNGAPDLSLVRTENGQPFGINNEIVYVVANHCDFNRFYIKYHQFRLDSGNIDLAKNFFALACFCIQMTLGTKPEDIIPSEGKTLPELVELFYNTVDHFFKQHKDSIKNLRFSHLQQDSIAASPHAIEKLFIGSLENDLFSSIRTWSEKTVEELEDKYPSAPPLDSPEESEKEFYYNVIDEFVTKINPFLKEMASMPEKIKEVVTAGQIVTSINVSFLFRSALNMVLEKPATFALESEDIIQYLKDISEILKRRENKIVNVVYSEIDEENLSAEDMETYRKRTGIDAGFLSQNEKHLANITLVTAFKDEHKRMIGLAKECNVKELLEAKRHLRDRLFHIDDSAWAEKYVEQLDEISETLCSLLVEVCQQKENSFEAIRNNLCKSLGPESVRLPKNSIDPLATAELLYKEYANQEFAAQGFDYSSISALYYQAFEAAYNELIWRDYEKALTEILTKATDKSIFSKVFEGYLDPAYAKFYADININTGKIKQIKQFIMYKNFGEILKNSIQNNSSKTREFCDYFVHKVGFSNRDSMYEDIDFARNFEGFVTAVLCAAGNRNNASHGGKIIRIEQLVEDKRTVLSDLEAVRSDSIGLIQQLLFLITYNCKSE